MPAPIDQLATQISQPHLPTQLGAAGLELHHHAAAGLSLLQRPHPRLAAERCQQPLQSFGRHGRAVGEPQSLRCGMHELER